MFKGKWNLIKEQFLMFFLFSLHIQQICGGYQVDNLQSKDILSPVPSTSSIEEYNNEDDYRTSELNRIKSYMNPEIDPCDDFYEFACGNFEKKPSILTEVKSKFKISLEKILTNSTNSAPQIKTDQKIRQLFKSCIKFASDCKEKLRQIIEFSKTIGEWPLLLQTNWSNNNNNENFDWLQRVAILRSYGIQTILHESIERNPNNPKEFILILAPEKVHDAIIKANMNDSSIFLTEFLKDVKDKIMIGGADNETADKIAKEIVKFEKDRYTILGNWTFGFDSVKEYRFENFTKKFPERKWNQFFKMIAGKSIIPSEKLLIINEELLLKLLDHYDFTKGEILANYMFYKMLSKLESFQISNSNACVSDIGTVMGYGVISLYLREYYNKETENNVFDIVNYIKWSMRIILTESIWMDDITKKEATMKLNNISPLIGYFKELLDTKWIDEFYRDFDINIDNFVKSAFFALRHKTWFEHDIHNKLNNFNYLYKDIDLLANEIKLIPNTGVLVVPPGLQISPLFNLELPKSLNFGTLGALIGNELTHGFDMKGKYYDNFGKYHKWWTKTTENAYEMESQCFVDFYSKYIFSTIHKAKIDGSATLFENIADNGGMKVAFLAYNTWYNEHKDLQGIAEDEEFPGINMSNRQLFFLGFGQRFCEWRVFRELLVKEQQNSCYSPAKYRVLGALANFEPFAMEFNCSVGSNMNPVRTCQVW